MYISWFCFTILITCTEMSNIKHIKLCYVIYSHLYPRLLSYLYHKNLFFNVDTDITSKFLHHQLQTCINIFNSAIRIIRKRPLHYDHILKWTGQTASRQVIKGTYRETQKTSLIWKTKTWLICFDINVVCTEYTSHKAKHSAPVSH